MNINLINAAVNEYICINYNADDTASNLNPILELHYYGSETSPVYGSAQLICSGMSSSYYFIKFRNENNEVELGVCQCGNRSIENQPEKGFISTTDIIQESVWDRYGFDRNVQMSFREWAKKMPVPATNNRKAA